MFLTTNLYLIRLIVYVFIARYVCKVTLQSSHDVVGPISHMSQEVSCYGPGDEIEPPGYPNHVPRHDVWRIQVCVRQQPIFKASLAVSANSCTNFLFTLAVVADGAVGEFGDGGSIAVQARAC